MSNMNIVLYGGGLDSTAVLFHLIASGVDPKKITLLHVAYGQKAARGERHAMGYFAHKYGVNTEVLHMDMGYSSAHIMHGTPIGTAEDNRLELRNLVLISYAASYAASKYESSTLYVGFHLEPEGSAFLDARSEYLVPLYTLITSLTKYSVLLSAPFSSLTRTEILKKAIAFDKDIVSHSYTCYEVTPCRKCVHCLTKVEMMKELGNENCSSS